MNFRTKQAVDYWLGGFLLFCLFLPVRVLGIALRRDHRISRRKGCAVIKLVGAGSLLLAMPALQAIRGRFPAGSFMLVATRNVVDFARPFGWFDEYCIIDDSTIIRLGASSLRALQIIARHCDHLIDLEVHSRLTSVFSVFTMVRNRIGFVDNIVFWRRAFYTHMTYFNVQGPVYAFYDLLSDWFDIGRLGLREFYQNFRAKVLTITLPPSVQLPPRYIVIGPGCSDLSKERELLPSEWPKIIQRRRTSESSVVILGGPLDEPLANRIVAMLGGGLVLCGHLSIEQSARVIAGAEYYYGIDSMLLHIARALGVPTVSIWGPSKPSTLMRPGVVADTVLYGQLSCSPCIHVHETPPCRGARPCIPAALAATAQVLAADPSGTSEPAIGWAIGPTDPTVRAVQVQHD